MESEITKSLHSLVEDNEGLKRDNAELQRLLAESREDYDILQEELEEERARSPSRSKHWGSTSRFDDHRPFTTSTHSPLQVAVPCI